MTSNYQTKLEAIISNPAAFAVCAVRPNGFIYRFIGVFASHDEAAKVAEQYRSNQIMASVMHSGAFST